MLKPLIINLISPIKHYKALKFKKQIPPHDRSRHDLELALYSRILKNDMLHWGYYEQTGISPESISIADFEQAQMNYAAKLLEHIQHPGKTILDSGCGMGGLTALLKSKGFPVEALTPNVKQASYVRKKHPDIILHQCKYQDLKTDKKFGTIINSESLQYIPLDLAFKVSRQILDHDGRWIISDYFRINDDGINKSSHLIEDFREAVSVHQWRILHEEDMTEKVIPTARWLYLYAERFLLPYKEYAFDKLKYKKPWWYFMATESLQKIDKKINKELSAVDPDLFLKEKKYLLFVMEKND